MQSMIPFMEIHMHAEHRQLYEKLTADLEISSADKIRPRLQSIESNLYLIRNVLARLKAQTVNHSFSSDADEICFFKITKPHFHSLLIYWTEIFNLEVLRPLGGIKAEEKYLNKHLRKMRWFFEKHAEFYAYYRSGKTNLDVDYFKIPQESDRPSMFTHVFEIDPRYSTEKDWLAAKILAYERMQEYIEHSVYKLKHPTTNQDISSKDTLSLHWTASKASLIELIYALQSAGVYNNGNAGIKEVADLFQQSFKVDLGNYYNTFNEIRLRKKSRTALLDHLKEKVIQKMDIMDENPTDR